MGYEPDEWHNMPYFKRRMLTAGMFEHMKQDAEIRAQLAGAQTQPSYVEQEPELPDIGSMFGVTIERAE